MINYTAIFESHLQNLRDEGRYRTFATIGRAVGSYPQATQQTELGERAVTVWCSNDYLGMGHHPLVLREMTAALRRLGAGAGGTRNISGTHPYIVDLECELARVEEKEAALVFSSGYVANEAALATLGTMLPGCVILSDANNHASMIHGIKDSKAEKKIFRHNDLAHLEELLKAIGPHRPKVVAFESLYSMEGDIAPLKEIALLCKRYGALSYVDETHAVGVYGDKGGGVVQQRGLSQEIDVIQGGLGKGYGVVGGFIAGSAALIDLVRSFGSSFIFTTAMPPVVAAGALASVRYLSENGAERALMQKKVVELKTALREAGLPLLEGDGHMCPVIVGDSKLCKAVSDRLLIKHAMYIQPINYPTVPRGTERLRITISPLHDSADIRALIEALCETWRHFSLPLKAEEAPARVALHWQVGA